MTTIDRPVEQRGTDLSVPGPQGQLLLAAQEETESSARTYPRRLPIAIAHARGPHVVDVDGRRYLDFLTGAGVLALGHNPPELVAAVRAQLDVLTHGLDLPTPVRAEFARRQLDMLPAPMRGNRKIHFCGPTGADGVEAAIKLCKKATGRGGVITFQGSYHGSTHATMSFTSEAAPKEGLANLLPGVHFSPFGYCHRCPLSLTPDQCGTRCAALLENTLRDTHGGVPKPAAILLELVQGEGGVVPAPVEFVQRVAALAAELDIPLVVDEVQTGCGRTGTWFAFERYGIEPDVVVASKGLSGMGLPVSIILYHRRLDGWAPGSHIGTFRGNNLAFASALAFLDVVARDDVLGNARRVGDHLLDGLRALAVDSPLIADVRGVGMMLGLEMRGLPAAGASATEVAARVQRAALRAGLIVEIGGREDCVVRMLPPLDLSPELADQALAALASAVHAVAAELAEEAGR
ncbi:diaminobutyrate-2-oxoglutarate transaminase [Actinokineospora baliensis]|uniref:aspartate aminotransferase family protein n=1 Tax=Actinokineospora baliensis TaxID=547056 RepID=UPI00195A2FA0|nr:diaminobutyrate--2-oxoglutarate transaminase family protein [Actinokineospora baliensis]MBM7773849.1 diaminobutyrate-2-oxoglutarate transaminase [Actinokineospora baliensis]